MDYSLKEYVTTNRSKTHYKKFGGPKIRIKAQQAQIRANIRFSCIFFLTLLKDKKMLSEIFPFLTSTCVQLITLLVMFSFIKLDTNKTNSVIRQPSYQITYLYFSFELF